MAFLAAIPAIVQGVGALAGAASAVGGAVGGKSKNSYSAPGVEEAGTYYNQAGQGLNTLAQQLQQQAQGNGVNLANQQLQNATGQNVADQAALMAGQRGAAQNVGLMARQAAQQGAGIQQQAAGQAAQNRLQEQLMSQQLLSQTLGQQGQLGASVLNHGNSINSQTAATNQQTQNNMMGGIGSAVGALAPAIGGLFSGGKKDNGIMPGTTSVPSSQATYDFMTKKAEGGMMEQPQQQQQVQWTNNFLMGNRPSAQPQRMANGGLPFMPHDYEQGGHVEAANPSQKAVKPGNSYSNDKIPAMLSEGEIVIPRDVVATGNPQASAQFVSQVMQGKHRKK